MTAGRSHLDLAWLSARDPSWLRLRPRSQLAFLVAGCLLISAWQVEFLQNRRELNLGERPPITQLLWFTPHLADRPWTRSAGIRGTYIEGSKPFFYFFYYTGIFPVTIARKYWTAGFLADDEEKARQALESPHLVMEQYKVIRKGDLGQIFLRYPDVWRGVRPANATPRTFNGAIAVASLLALFVSLSLLEHRMLASFLVAVLGSNPYQLQHLYVDANIWGYAIATGTLALALHAPLLLARRFRPAFYAIPLLAGLLFATVREIRTEPSLLVLSSAAVLLFMSGSWRRRVALLALLAVSYAATSLLWSTYWERRFDEAGKAVAHTNVAPINLRNTHHTLWHPVWAGLGDFARDRGYRWGDSAAYEYAIPEINRRFGTHYAISKEHRYLLQNLDSENGYKIPPESLPYYPIVLRSKVLGDIAEDPLWYLGILASRAERILRLTTPIRLGLGRSYFDVPFSGWLLLPALALVLAARRWEQAKLLAFYLPCSLPAFLIYSRGGMTNPSAFHIVTFGLVGCWIVHLATRLYVRLREMPAQA